MNSDKNVINSPDLHFLCVCSGEEKVNNNNKTWFEMSLGWENHDVSDV